MKRWIHSATDKSYRIDSVRFVSKLVDALKQLLPKNCWPKPSVKYDQVIIENVPSKKKLYTQTVKALEELGYNVYNILGKDDEGYELAAVNDSDAFVKLIVDVGDYFNNGEMGYIDMDFDNGSAIFEDWYED